MANPPLNIDYWSSLYRVYEEDNEQYENAIQEIEIVEKAGQLWQWKDLSRSIPFENIAPILDTV